MVGAENMTQADEKLINSGLQALVGIGAAVAFYTHTNRVQRTIAVSTILLAISIAVIDQILVADRSSLMLSRVWWVLCAIQDLLIILFFAWPRFAGDQ
jgi:hypothetical protein